MEKNWMIYAIAALEHSLKPVPIEINELDWKQDISPNKEKLSQHISAFSNLPGGGYMVFGIENSSAKILGVTKEQCDNIIDKLSNLSRDRVEPMVSMDHCVREYEGKNLLFVWFEESSTKPVSLKNGGINESYIRCGGTTRKASRQEIGGLMLNSKTPQYEELYASKLKSDSEILNTLNYSELFKMLGKPIPQQSKEILKFLKEEKMIKEVDGSGYYITNLGVLTCALQINDFDDLSRKAIRLIKYKGVNKESAEKDISGVRGYAIGFSPLISHITAMLPSSEVMKNALRTPVSVYPEIAIRELCANALIHQDFSIRGASPMIEIFDNRIEISNPGKLLPSKKIDRLIRATPESRNEVLASTFRRLNICEERGSGMEKTAIAIELYGLPALKFEEFENSFRVTMYSPKNFSDLTPSERIDACYQHCQLKYFSGQGGMTNTTLRERFKLHDRQRSSVSNVIKESIEQGRIKPKDPNSVSTKFTEYVPYWV